MSEFKPSKLTAAQKARIERNREKALSIRHAKLVSHPYANNKKEESAKTALNASDSIIKVQGTKYIDSGGGFLLEQIAGNQNKNTAGKHGSETGIGEIKSDAIEVPVQFEECLDCGDIFADSFLFSNFGYSVCDKCRDSEERHSLITRTEAKAEYLLKDCDLDKRDPPLRYISRKNPHNVRWGEMKLYLHLQIQERAMEVWGSEEELMRQHEGRDEKREVSKLRKYKKQMKQLRMEVRSSLYTKETKASHEHEFGEDTHNEEDDTYTHSCISCPYTETYEKI